MKLVKRIKSISNKLMESAKNCIVKNDIYYIVEDADWAIMHVGKMVTSHLSLKSSITTSCFGIKKSLIHYGSLNTFFKANRINLPHPSNKIIVTIFHIAPSDTRIKLFIKAIKYIDIWHTSCNLTKDKLINLGVSKDRIVVIPLGVELHHFKPIKNKNKIRQELRIPNNKIVIGSFQKDGNGWGKGLKPKLIKGPDIFCDVVEKLSKKYDIFVLLTGPARGYVKKRLEVARIPYKHDFLDESNEVAKYFQAVDLYMVASREEGGPKAILESLASGVPIISTKVGMAPDIIIDNENGFLVDIENIDLLYEKSCELIDNKNLKNKFIQNGLKAIKNYDWQIIAKQYYKELYKELL